MLTNSTLHITTPVTHENELPSDHAPVTCNITGATNIINQGTIPNYKQANWLRFQQHIHDNIDPNIVIETIEEIDNGIDQLIRTIKDAEKAAVPYTKKTNKFLSISDCTKNLIIQRNNTKRLWQRCQEQQRKATLKSKVNELNRLIKINVDHDRNTKWSQTMSKLETGSKKFWHLTKKIKGKFANNITKLTHNNEILTTPTDKANAIANTFEKTHQLTQHTISPFEAKVREFNTTLDNEIHQPEPENLVKSDELLAIIKSLKNSKAPGLDCISNILIKHLPKRAIIILKKIFNACLKIGYFPKSFKIAKVIPIPKPGKDLRNTSSYRPISLLSCIGKLLEKIILNRLLHHVTENNIINPKQFGFRKQHSTVHQLKRVTKYIKQNKNLRRSTGMVLLDIEKAFDTIWHEGLIYKLNVVNTPKYLIKIIKSFISNRKFQVTINGILSIAKTISAGLPQGSILSPSLYSIFISDFKGCKDCDIAYYADDTAIYTNSKLSNTLIRRLQNALNKISDYLTKWKIKINTQKTQAIIFPFNRSYRRTPTIDMQFQNNNIEITNEVKYLGVTLDKKLNFKSHIENTKMKTIKCMYSLYPMLKSTRLSIKNKNILYKTVIRPIITYAAPIWCEAPKRFIKILQIVQNRCLKLIHGKPRLFRTARLHEETEYPMINELIHTLTTKFKTNCENSTYEMIQQLYS